MDRGIFITFEGCEGAGKTTLLDSIETYLLHHNRSVLRTREPGGTELGEKIRQILLHEGNMNPYSELCLFLASRSQHISEVIGPALEQGKVVLCDRFNDSSIVYQGAARGLGMSKVEEFCQFISHGISPDLTLYLDIDPVIGLSRASNQRNPDRMESEEITFHKKIREAYHHLHQSHPKRLKLLDASMPREEVFQIATGFIDQLLKNSYA
jgi:dTMP kinase